MRDDQIQQVLDRLNAGKADDIVLRPISRNVLFGLAWGAGDEIETRAQRFFFVRKDNSFVAAVHWFGREEMHWYVSPEHRGQGLLVKPLTSAIFPYIFEYLGVDAQRASIEPTKFAAASEKLALKVGFKFSHEVANTKHFMMEKPTDGQQLKLPSAEVTLEDLAALQRETQRALRSVGIIADRLRLQNEGNPDAPAYGDFADGMKAMLGEVENYADRMRWKIEGQATPELHSNQRRTFRTSSASL